MSTASPTYAPPIRRRVEATALDFELIDAASARFEAGDFLGSVHKIVEHLLPGERFDLARQPGAFTQGSSRVNLAIEGDALVVSVPLIRLPTGGGAVAALRYLLAKVNGTGQLYQARLRGDDVHLEFREQLSALPPPKLLEVLRRMPLEADRHDDWMVDQFGATALERGTVEPVDDDEFARAEAIWRGHWADVEDLLKEAQRKRSRFFLNETTAFAVYRIRFVLPLGGALVPRLLESADVFNDTDVDAMKREATLAKCAKEMRAISGAELRRNLGHVAYAISPVAEGTAARLTGFFGPGSYMESIDKFRSTGQAMDAALALIGTYYYLLATHAWSAAIEDELKRGLTAASGAPWRDAANTLYDHAQALIESLDDDDADDEEAADE